MQLSVLITVESIAASSLTLRTSIFRGTLRMQSNNAVWGAEVQELLQQGMSSPRRGVDVGDHPPITPMRSAGESELGHDAFRLYELITRVFIATVRPCVCYSRRCPCTIT